MSIPLAVDFEKAVRFLVLHFPVSDASSRKPVLFHDIRVGMYLYERAYSNDVILAGVLHDALEWSNATEQELRGAFGDTITRLIRANTKDDSIADAADKTNELIQRCVANGQDALIVKATDIIDSFQWYANQNNAEQLQYCARNADAIAAYKPNDFEDRIFNDLEALRKRFS